MNVNPKFFLFCSRIPKEMEKEMATHSSTAAWEIPWSKRRLVGYSPGGRTSQTLNKNPKEK